MTKAEVQYNIKYNERLVVQYQNQINSLHQQIDNLRAQNRNMNARISDCASRINKLEGQIGDLNQLRNKYQTLQTDFSKRHADRVRLFNANFSRRFNVDFINAYIAGMKDLLSGSEYRKAYDGLTTARNIIQKKRDGLQKETDSLHWEIKNVQRIIAINDDSINAKYRQINSVSADLSYRRQRRSYWQNQLKYCET